MTPTIRATPAHDRPRRGFPGPMGPASLAGLALAALLGLVHETARAQTPLPGHVVDQGWPRQFTSGDQTVTVSQPQVEEWPDFERITFRAAITVGPTDGDERALGVLRMSADTQVAHAERQVVLTHRKTESLVFNDVEPLEAMRLQQVISYMEPAVPGSPARISKIH